MTSRMICVADTQPQRWRNGRGWTRELLVWPDADAAPMGEWRVRVSVADIESDGPFSAYPTVRRWFTVLDGGGVELTIDGTPHRLDAAAAPLQFAGDAAITCRLLDGPTRDLNLMLRGERGAMLRAVDGQAWQPRATQCGLYSALAGHCRHDGETVAVPAHALLWFDHSPESLTFVATVRRGAAPGWWLAATVPATRP